MHTKQFLPFGVLLAVTLLSAAFLSSNTSFADEEIIGASVTVSSACTMFRESTVAHAIAGLPDHYYQDIGTTRLNTMCNDKDGYTIYAVGYSNDEEGNTNMIGEEHDELIPTGIASGDTSNWSMKIAKDAESYMPENLSVTLGYENYHIVPSTQTRVATFAGATDTVKGSVITTTYAIRVSSTQIADTYNGQVKYTMVHPAGGSIPNMLSLQDIDKESCPTIPTAFYDPRDGEVYTVQKLADGNCWFLENLRLGSASSSIELTSENTNMPAGTTYTLPASSNGSFDVWETPLINVSSKDLEQSYGSASGKTGVYYNMCAASLGEVCALSSTVDATRDVCPAGWRLPTGGHESEYENLYLSYDSVETFKEVFHAAPYGRYYGNAPIEQGENGRGRYWSSTNSSMNSYAMYVLSTQGNDVTAAAADDAYYMGVNVRCVAKEPEPIKIYIQDVTIETCPTEPTIVYDRRDEEAYTIQKLADGNCWLLDNLHLDIASLSLDDLEGETNASSATLSYLKNGGGTTSDQYATASIGDLISGNSYSVPLINTASKNTTGTGGYEAGKYGVYYNYCAASAGSYCYGDGTSAGTPSGDATEDICPKGWRMPTGGASGEYQALYTAYNSDYTSYINALRTPLSGYFNNGSALHQGSDGIFWSSTSYSSNYMRILRVDASYVYPRTYDFYRYDGYSVRCIAKEAPDPEPEKIYIQDVTLETCPTEPTTVYDRRDEEEYTIQKLADGNCWLLDNLRLDPTTLKTTLTIENTNMDPSTPFTLPGSTSSNFFSYTEPRINTDSKNTIQTYGDGSGKSGVFYNYCAATAGTYCYAEYEGTGSAKYDICPKGWRLPTGGENGEYETLFTLLGEDKMLYKNTLRMALSGNYGENAIMSAGSFTTIWSATNEDSSRMYNIGASSSDVYLGGYTNRFLGYSVRCIAYNGVEPEPLHDIQDVTPSTCPTTPTTVYDTRDGQAYTIQKLADGKCWMLDNLRLGKRALTVLTPDDTNITSNFTLPASIDSGFNSYVLPQINIDSKSDTVGYGSGENKIGVYYNFCAATAGTYCQPLGESSGTPTQDICPKGWRLPTGGDEGEYQALFNEYDTYAEFKNALHASLSGYFKYAQNNHQGSYGSFWSSTPVGDDRMYSLDVRLSSVPDDFTSYRTAGLSIRCVAYEQPKTYIQDIDASTCPTTPTTVYDTRDNSAYTIQKLADGNCWMLDNLRIGKTTDRVLTPDDTNITSNFTLPGSVSENFNEYTVPQINIDSKNKITSYGDGNNKIGVYYNFCAATAGTYCYAQGEAEGSPTEDICPKGWRMPTGGESGEYQTLYSKYNTYADFKNALRASLSGYFKYAQNNHQGSYGSFWSTTPVGDDRMYSLDVRADSVPDDFTSYRTAGISVRCVAVSNTIYIQDVTTATCPTTPTVVYDKRDNEEYTIQKLADGKCWMLDHLRLDPATLVEPLTSENTNLASGRTYTLPSSISSGFNNYSAAQINTDSKNTLVNYGTGAAQGKAGVYYNYCAATAGTVCYSSSTATQDICPAGWRLPTGGSSGGEFNDLYRAYDSNMQTFGDAFHMAFTGVYWNNGRSDFGIKGRSWSATSRFSGNSYGLCYEFENGVYKINTADTNGQDIGMGVRCVAK